MQRLQSYKYELMPDGEQERDMRRFAGSCGYENNADVVGAMNVLERGYRLLACGESVQSGRSVKQEPTEGRTQKLRSPVGIPVL